MNWHYLENGETRGPVTQEEFVNLVKQGVITTETHLWAEGMADWKKYGDLIAGRKPAAVAPVESATPEAAAAGGSLHIQHEHVAGERQATCSRCGSVGPASQLHLVGSSALCPKCQVGHQRLGLGISAPMEYANPFLRLAAFILDAIIFGVVFSVVMLVLNWGTITSRAQPSFARLGVTFLFYVWWWLHYFIWRVSGCRATYGMKLLKISIVHETGGLISGWRAFGRNFIFGLVLQFTGGLGNLTVFFDQRRRTLQDMVCSTVVIKN